MQSVLSGFVSAMTLPMPTAYAASLPGDSVNGKRLYDAIDLRGGAAGSGECC